MLGGLTGAGASTVPDHARTVAAMPLHRLRRISVEFFDNV
jgi:hypothetical protein